MAQDSSMSVDLALVLAVDVSTSVDSSDYKIQMQGIAAALRNPDLHKAISNGEFGRMALMLVQWSRADSQNISIPWKLLESPSDFRGYAQLVEAVERKGLPGGTGMAEAIKFCTLELLRLKISATRRVIDVSGDGMESDGGDVPQARDAAVALGATINGLPILSGSHLLQKYYEDNVIGGDDAFVLPAVNILAFRKSMTEKLLREVGARVV